MILSQVSVGQAVQTGDDGEGAVALELPPAARDAGEQPDGEADEELDGRHGQGGCAAGPPHMRNVCIFVTDTSVYL